MTYRIRVEHTSRYQYASPVSPSFNEVRISPMTTPWQLVLDSSVEVVPATSLQRYVDYWGSVVHAFDIHHAHAELTIVGKSVVETTFPDRGHSGLGWADLREEKVLDRFSELLAPTSQVPANARLLATAEELKGRCTPIEAGFAAVDWAHEQLTYVPGTTGVHTSAVEAWEGGEGVCQDFAHLMLALVRAMGLPGRYCSGYMHPVREPTVGETLEGESHAWVEVWSGDWHALDPTAGRPLDARYVLVARGRDYADVAPVRGIFLGGPTAQLVVNVSMTRMA
jgi:transglutaminase-like putative cysteine protease